MTPCAHYYRERFPYEYRWELIPRKQTKLGYDVPVKSFTLYSVWDCVLCEKSEKWFPTEPQRSFHGDAVPTKPVKEERARA